MIFSEWEEARENYASLPIFIVFTDVPHGSCLEASPYLATEAQSTQKQVDGNQAPDEDVDDCKTGSSLVIAVVRLLVSCTHASTLLRT